VPSSVSVWNTAPTSAPAQRKGRYVPGSAAHPAKMHPGIAAHAIRIYTRPGDLVLDPMCGIGTTLVEAIHLGRNALGVEYEPKWAHLARLNAANAAHDGGPAKARSTAATPANSPVSSPPTSTAPWTS
jgi:modification methylase